MIYIYTTASSSGYCAITLGGSLSSCLTGTESKASSNRAELLAVIYALEALPVNSKVTICTSNTYVEGAITKGAIWLKKSKPANSDLIKKLIKLIDKHIVRTRWLSSQTNDKYYKYSATLARKAYSGELTNFELVAI